MHILCRPLTRRHNLFKPTCSPFQKNINILTTRNFFGKPDKNGQRYWTKWCRLYRETAVHGAEIHVLLAYSILVTSILVYSLYHASQKVEIEFYPSLRSINDKFNHNLDWNNPRQQRLLGPLCRRHEKFWENKLGWKTDLKKLLDEIYAFTDHSDIPLPLRYTEACTDETSTFERYMISHADEVSTVLMKKALYKALKEGSNLNDKELKHLERYL